MRRPCFDKPTILHLATRMARIGNIHEFDPSTESVEYLGHRIDATGLHPTSDKLAAIHNAPSPSNVQELRSYLGLLNYYGRLVPHLATIVQPLNQLLQKDAPWNWSSSCERAFQQTKSILASTQVLVHYNSKYPLRLAVDASAYGVGAVISHIMPNGEERPTAFASRTLSKSERNYAQLEKEALALVFGVKKFHKFLYGRKFTLVTDHKPLTTILHPQKTTPPLAAARLQRWALLLSAYQYTIEFRSTGQHANADGLSRLPIKGVPGEESDVEATALFNLGQVDNLPLTSAQLRTATRNDPILGKVLQHTKEGWKTIHSQDHALQPYSRRSTELSVEGDCVLWGTRVIIPEKYRRQVLDELHLGHSGMSRMKALARSYVWWPEMDEDIKNMVKACLPCQSVKSSPPAAPLHPWLWPSKPWSRVHIDFAGPFKGKMYFLLVDAHSKWPEIHEMSSTTTQKTIDILRSLFSSYGLPEQLASDNGPQFTSSEFESFMKMNGIKHIRTSPYHPASNGAVEHLVQTFKQAMKSASNAFTSQQQLCTFLISYRNTPHTTTGETPSMLFLKRSLRTRLDLLRPTVDCHVRSKQAQQIGTARHAKNVRIFSVGDRVLARDFRQNGVWKPGHISVVNGPLSYIIQLDSGETWRRHVDHLKHVTTSTSDKTTPLVTASDDTTTDFYGFPSLNSSPVTPPIPQNQERRYPHRNRRPVDRFTYNIRSSA